MKVFQINDTEWYAANSTEQALTLHRDMCGDDADMDGVEVIELSEYEMDKRIQAFDEDERPIPDATTSAREMLAEVTEPGWLASSEW